MTREQKLTRKRIETLLAKNSRNPIDLSSYKGVFELIESDKKIFGNRPSNSELD